MNKETEYKISIIGGGILILLGAFYNFSGIAGKYISLIFINVGIILVVLKTLQLNKFGAGIIQDERTRKISTRATSYSWLITFVSLNILFWIDTFKIINISLNQGIGIVIFIMIISTTFLKYVLKDKEI